jgi:hypothetical protein
MGNVYSMSSEKPRYKVVCTKILYIHKFDLKKVTNKILGRCQGLTPVILATKEAAIRRIVV